MIYRKSGGQKAHRIAPEEGLNPKIKQGYDRHKASLAIKALEQELFTPVTIEYMAPKGRRQ